MKLTAQLPSVAGLYSVNYKTLSDDPESNIPLGAVMSDNERIVQVRADVCVFVCCVCVFACVQQYSFGCSHVGQ
jgi:hypothetical protein